MWVRNRSEGRVYARFAPHSEADIYQCGCDVWFVASATASEDAPVEKPSTASIVHSIYIGRIHCNKAN
jgi:hypothetical protein